MVDATIRELPDVWRKAATVLRELGLGPVGNGQAVQMEICADQLESYIALEATHPQPVTPAGGDVDSKRLDFMQSHRVALIPEFEGPWDAEVYREGEVSNVFSGSTPREAIDEAMRNEN